MKSCKHDSRTRTTALRQVFIVSFWLCIAAVISSPFPVHAQSPPDDPPTCAQQGKIPDPTDPNHKRCLDDAPQGVPPWVEYRKRLEPSQQIAPLEAGFAGDEVSRYNGATVFSVTDISIPGNFAVPVQLVRRLDIALQPQDEIQPYDARLLGAGNWDVDVPYIAATYPTATGWTAQRCSQGSVPPLVNGPNGRFQRGEVWQGLTVHLPDRGDTVTLGLDALVPVPSAGSYKLATRERDVVSCIAMQSRLTGEGFRLTTTDGVSYDFDVAVTRTAAKLVKMIQNDGVPPLVPVYLPRTR